MTVVVVVVVVVVFLRNHGYLFRRKKLTTIQVLTTLALYVYLLTCSKCVAGLADDVRKGMWQLLNSAQPKQGIQTIFGKNGERGEYMDGYSKQAMWKRCEEDYKWSQTFPSNTFDQERAKMMAHLYTNPNLWKFVCMVAFAEHYVLVDKEEATSSPFLAFQDQLHSQPDNEPVFGGVVFGDWQSCDQNTVATKLALYKEQGIDYVRLECNFGSAQDIGDPSQLAESPTIGTRFSQLAKIARQCQIQQLVPLILLQVPWREPGVSKDYFDGAIHRLAAALKKANVESKQLLLESRPPIGMSAQEERSQKGNARISLGLEVGKEMFKTIEDAFSGSTIPGFCVAGGSTKGDLPTAMEDDTQNAVRQGIRHCAQQSWGYDMCFWEMGAKLMLQPNVGRLWAKGPSGRDAARELFCVNAEDMADEIKTTISITKESI